MSAQRKCISHLFHWSHGGYGEKRTSWCSNKEIVGILGMQHYLFHWDIAAQAYSTMFFLSSTFRNTGLTAKEHLCTFSQISCICMCPQNLPRKLICVICRLAAGDIISCLIASKTSNALVNSDMNPTPVSATHSTFYLLNNSFWCNSKVHAHLSKYTVNPAMFSQVIWMVSCFWNWVISPSIQKSLSVWGVLSPCRQKNK